MTHTTTGSYYWQGADIRLRPMHVDDVGLWLAEERFAPKERR